MSYITQVYTSFVTNKYSVPKPQWTTSYTIPTLSTPQPQPKNLRSKSYRKQLSPMWWVDACILTHRVGGTFADRCQPLESGSVDYGLENGYNFPYACLLRVKSGFRTSILLEKSPLHLSNFISHQEPLRVIKRCPLGKQTE